MHLQLAALSFMQLFHTIKSPNSQPAISSCFPMGTSQNEEMSNRETSEGATSSSFGARMFPSEPHAERRQGFTMAVTLPSHLVRVQQLERAWARASWCPFPSLPPSEGTNCHWGVQRPQCLQVCTAYRTRSGSLSSSWRGLACFWLTSSRKMRSYWRESSGGLRGWRGDWSICLIGKAWGSWSSSAWRREREDRLCW